MPQEPQQQDIFKDFQAPATGDGADQFKGFQQPVAQAQSAAAPRVQVSQPGFIDRTLNTANQAYEGATPISPSLSWDYTKNLGSRVGSSLGRFAMALPNLANGVRHAATDPYNNEEQAVATAAEANPNVPGPVAGRIAVAGKRLLYDPQKAEYDKAKTAAEQGHTSESMGHSIAAAVPLVGPFAASEGERAGKGDIAGAVTDVGAMYAIPKVLKEAAPGGRLPGAPAEDAPAFPVTKNIGAKTIRAVGKAAPVAIPTAVEAGIGHVVGGPVGTGIGVGLGLGTGFSRVGEAIASHPVVRGMAEFGLSPAEVLKDNLVEVGDKSVSPETKAAIDSGKIDIGKLVKDDRLSGATGKDVWRNPDGAEPTFTRIGNRMQVQQSAATKQAFSSTGKPVALNDLTARDQVIRGVRGNPADRVAAPAPEPPKISTLSGTQQELPLTMGENIEGTSSAAPNIAASPETSVSPSMGEYRAPSFEEMPLKEQPSLGMSPNGKRVQVGRAGESKAARANSAVSEAEGNLKSQHGGSVDSATKDTNTSLGQFAQTNGPRIDAAVPNTPEGQTLANHLHSITNRELGQVAQRLSVDIGGKSVGRNGISRTEVFGKMLDAGHSPEDIINTHYEKVFNPPSVGGGAPDISNRPGSLPNATYKGNPNLSTDQVRARLAEPRVQAGAALGNMLMEEKYRTPSVSGKSQVTPKPNIAEASEGKVWRDETGEQNPVKIKYEHGQPVDVDGRHRIIQAFQNGFDRIEVTVDRGNGSIKTTVPVQRLMQELGVTPESLAKTDAQQVKIRAGALKPRIAVTKP